MSSHTPTRTSPKTATQNLVRVEGHPADANAITTYRIKNADEVEQRPPDTEDTKNQACVPSHYAMNRGGAHAYLL